MAIIIEVEKITLRPVYHRGKEQILIVFQALHWLNQIVRRIPGIQWSSTYRSWYVELTRDNYRLICRVFKDQAVIDNTALKEYLEKRKLVDEARVRPRAEEIKPVEKVVVLRSKGSAGGKNYELPAPSVAFKLSMENLKELQRAVQTLILKAYSRSTIRTYRAELLIFFQALGKHPATSLGTEDVKRWLLINYKQGLTENTLHSRINALKFYYEKVLGRERFFLEIPRPKKHLQLPKVLGEEEIRRLFNAIGNLKHKAILFAAYSAGLRVSEVVNLKLADIDSDRMQLFIERAKGKKDRYVNLSPLLLDILRNYILTCKVRPKRYLFEGPAGAEYSARSAQKVFQIARERAGITKEVSFHSLRHSFATHILEKGVDIRYIKDILGHFSIKTTERYLHVRRDTLINISSPLDDLWKKGGLEW